METKHNETPQSIKALNNTEPIVKVQIVGDLHLEAWKKDQYPKVVSDYLVISGGLCKLKNKQQLRSFLSWASNNYKHVLYVPGIKEYYDFELLVVDQLLTEICKEFTNVTYLNKLSAKINGVIFLGCCLWHFIPDENKSEMMRHHQDFKHLSSNNVRLTPSKVNSLYLSHLQWLLQEYATIDKAIPVCIITGNSPLPKENSYPQTLVDNPQYKKLLYNNDLTQMILYDKNTNIKGWIFSGTDHSCSYRLSSCTIISNSLGYPSNRENVVLPRATADIASSAMTTEYQNDCVLEIYA